MRESPSRRSVFALDALYLILADDDAAAPGRSGTLDEDVEEEGPQDTPEDAE